MDALDIDKRAKEIAAELNSAVNAVLMAKVYAECMREKIDSMDSDILAEFEYKTDPRFIEKGRPARITEPRLTYMMCDVDAEDYYKERQSRIDAMGYKLPHGHCPALVAENVLREAEHLLIHNAEQFFPGVTVDTLLCSRNGLENFRKYIDLLIRLVVNAPGYHKPAFPARAA